MVRSVRSAQRRNSLMSERPVLTPGVASDRRRLRRLRSFSCRLASNARTVAFTPSSKPASSPGGSSRPSGEAAAPRGRLRDRVALPRGFMTIAIVARTRPNHNSLARVSAQRRHGACPRQAPANCPTRVFQLVLGPCLEGPPMPTLNPEIIREYDIRGVADRDFSDEACYLLGRAIGAFQQRAGKHRITLGRDCRLHSERIGAAVL